ncbi:putative efflux pump antibiotic resistance protein [Aureobasidium pullulans]|uniref:Efflux pump antibiotic resistance protein n=1 Tax=Aureobasidium pullulans TaxID=5580 RepID=A0AB74J9Y3_AURPU|nr:putative efflux pump antibiotic resistance protein [Aureobasidium pullulans]
MAFRKLKSHVTMRTTSVVSDTNLQQNVEDGRNSPKWKPSKQVKLIVATQAFVCFFVALDSTILTTTLPTLSKALHTNTTQTFWIATSYLLTSAVFQPPIAALSDIFGRQALFLLAIILFTIGSIVCCASHGIVSMLIGRSVKGIGGGGILSLNLIILSDIIPLRQRAQYQGYLQLCFALGSNIAPVIGGLIVERTTWRWLFLINLPFCAISLATVPFIIRYSRPKITIRDRLLSIDWAGITMSTTSTTLFLIGISWGGTEYSWSSAATLCPLIIGIAGVLCTVIYEMKFARMPFLRISLFHNRSAIAAYVCTMLMAFSVYATLYYLVLWLLAVKEMSEIMAGAVWAGWAIATLGIGTLVLLDQNTSTLAYVFMFVCAGIGLGLLMNSLSAAIQAISPTKDVAYASSMFAFMRSLGLCLGVSIGGTIFQNFLRQRLEHHGLSTELAENAEVYVSLLRSTPSSPQKILLKEIINWAFRMLFATLCGICGLGLIISVIIGKYSMDKELDSQHVIVQSESESEGKREVSDSSVVVA